MSRRKVNPSNTSIEMESGSEGVKKGKSLLLSFVCVEEEEEEAAVRYSIHLDQAIEVQLSLPLPFVVRNEFRQF